MFEFKSWLSYDRFVENAMRSFRYHLDQQDQDFLAAVAETAQSRIVALSAGSMLWRAQKSDLVENVTFNARNEQDEEDDFANGANPENEPLLIEVPCKVPSPPERMRPQRDVALEGRVNAKGIPCLYAADDPNTAMAEMRPSKDQTLSLARLHVNRELRLVNCCQEMTQPRFDRPMTAAENERVVWGLIAFGFSVPVERKDNSAEYAPTQIIGELFRRNGFDGIKFRSGLGKGSNFALFDLDAADVIPDVSLYRTADVAYSFEPEVNPYQFSYSKAQIDSSEGAMQSGLNH
jgi:hypothetical protein